MLTSHPTLAPSEALARWQTHGVPQSEKPLANAAPVIITGMALKKIVEAKEELGPAAKGIRVRAHPRSSLRADFSMQFVPTEEVVPPTDSIYSYEGIDLYIALDSAPYLEGATIDFAFSLISSDFRIEAPLRKLDTPEGRIAVRIQQVLDEEIIPALATHGGGAVLVDCEDGIVFLKLTGGCQGCSMAAGTLKDGIETSLRRRFPEIREVRDVTKHADGRNPYA